jgi:NADPH-dependent 2,4-dienoyl-CoA reductase/sulfur reductase-like enzyme
MTAADTRAATPAAAAGAAASVAAEAGDESPGFNAHDPTTRVDVLVLGAGIAGLAAAAALRARGLSVLLLEGRNRIGEERHL